MWGLLFDWEKGDTVKERRQRGRPEGGATPKLGKVKGKTVLVKERNLREPKKTSSKDGTAGSEERVVLKVGGRPQRKHTPISKKNDPILE